MYTIAMKVDWDKRPVKHPSVESREAAINEAKLIWHSAGDVIGIEVVDIDTMHVEWSAGEIDFDFVEAVQI
jgi:hypothetical protein